MVPTRSLLLKILTASTAAAAAFLLILDLAAKISTGSTEECYTLAINPLPRPADLDAAFSELAAGSWLPSAGRAVSIGPDPGPAAAAMRRLGLHPVIASAATACCGIPFEAASFDLAFSAALDRVRVPARVVLEMERLLRPGRVGVILRTQSGSVRPDGLMKAASPVASLLRLSDVIGARDVNGSSMVVFRKRVAPESARGMGCEVDAMLSKIPFIFQEITKLVFSGFAFGSPGSIIG